MTKIKILLIIILTVIVLNFLKLFYYFTSLNSLDELFNSDTEGHLLAVLYILTVVLFFIAHLTLSRGLWHIIKYNYFNERSIKDFHIAGVLLITFGILTLIFRVYFILNMASITQEFESYSLIEAFENGYTIILGFALITIKSILKKGRLLQTENDLTI